MKRRTKRHIFLLIAVSLCLIFCGCKSKEATMVDDAILAIGEASESNIGKMKSALKSYNDLTTEQKAEVENYNVLMSLFSEAFNQGEALLNNKEYRKAKEIFSQLGEYNNSAEYAERCTALDIGADAYKCAVDYLKEQLIDPFSLRIIKTTFTFSPYKNSEYHIVVNLQYVANNKLGGPVNDTFSFTAMRFVEEEDLSFYEAVFYLYSDHFCD